MNNPIVIILTYAVLDGLTTLIPIPYVDDWVRGFFNRLMVKALADRRGIALTERELNLLASPETGGWLGEMVGKAVLTPVRKFTREIIFVLEWRRALNTVSHAIYDGLLLEDAFDQGWLPNGDPRRAAALRAALGAAHAHANTRLMKDAVQTAFGGSRDVVKAAAAVMMQGVVELSARHGENVYRGWRWLLSRRIAPAAIRRQAQKAPERLFTRDASMLRLESQAQVVSLVTALQTQFNQIPAQHFESLRQNLARELTRRDPQALPQGAPGGGEPAA